MSYFNAGMFAEGVGLRPTRQTITEWWPGDGGLLTTGYIGTVTNVTETPVFAYVGGRPALTYTGAAAATDGSQLQIPSANIRPTSGKSYRFKASFYQSAVTGEIAFGLAAVGTAQIATPTSDYVQMRMKTGETTMKLCIRKASGTEVTYDTGVTIAAATWYDCEVVVSYAGVTGQASFQVYLSPTSGTTGVAGGGQLANVFNGTLSGQFPDTVSLAPFIAQRAGSGVVTVSWGYYGFVMEA